MFSGLEVSSNPILMFSEAVYSAVMARILNKVEQATLILSVIAADRRRVPLVGLSVLENRKIQFSAVGSIFRGGGERFGLPASGPGPLAATFAQELPLLEGPG